MPKRRSAVELRDVVRRLKAGQGIRKVNAETGVHRTIIRALRDTRRPRGGWHDFGLTPYSEEQQADLYELICERYEKSSTVVTSNREFSEWLGVFSNPLMGSAAMHRLVHRGIKIVIEGKSYRVDSFLKRSRTLTEEAKAG